MNFVTVRMEDSTDVTRITERCLGPAYPPGYTRVTRCIDSAMLSYEVTYDISFDTVHNAGVTCWMWLEEDCKYQFNYMPDKIKQYMKKNGSAVLT